VSRANLPYRLPPPPTFRRHTGLVFDPFYALHDVHIGPDLPARLSVIQAGLIAADLWERVVLLKPRKALQRELALVHRPAYIRQVRKDVTRGAGMLSTGDTEISEYSLDVAVRATGGVLAAVDAVMHGTITNAFCAVRPPGHHATPAKGMGFCIFNHVATAARYAQHRHGVNRVLIVDWDVHHGNGTQAAFYDDPTVLFFSSHQHPLYPGTGKRRDTGAGPGLGLTVNAPLPAGSGYHEIVGELETRLEPLLPKFRPELILISAGFDARVEDPLGDFTLQDEQFGRLTRRVMQWAEDYAGGRIVSVLEGGYNLKTLGGAVAAHVQNLALIDEE
jgi:acetoin utilization deacetylase AcuC-like enzyme